MFWFTIVDQMFVVQAALYYNSSFQITFLFIYKHFFSKKNLIIYRSQLFSDNLEVGFSPESRRWVFW